VACFRVSRLELLPVLSISATLLMSACSPSLNWRETRIAGTDLTAMMPCKSAQHQRTVPLAGLTVTLHMTACDADGATFAIAHTSIPDSSAAPRVLAEWRKTTLSNMNAKSVREARDTAKSPATPSSSLPTAPGTSMLAIAQGQRGDGSAVTLQGVWFARGAQVFHAAVYAPTQAGNVTTATTEPFFSGLKFQ
jgi:hypothetical protein